MRHSATKALLERTDTHHRRERVLHLRPRLADEYFDEPGLPRARRRGRPRRRSSGSSSTSSTSATTSTSTAAPSACAATSSRSSRPTRRARALRIEFFGDTIEAITEIDPLRGKAQRGLAARRDLSGEPLRHERAAPEGRDRKRSATSCSSASTELRVQNKLLEHQRLEQRTHLRPRDARGDGLLPRHRELLAPPRRPRPGRAAADAHQLLPDGLPARSSTRATSPSRRSAACTAATAPARRRSSSSASGCRRRSTTGRSTSRSSRAASGRRSTCRRRPATTSSRRARASSSSRSSARPASSIPRSRCGRRATRSTICSRRSASRIEVDERVLVTTLTKQMAEDLTDYFQDVGLKVRYLHSDVETLERVEIIRDLRRGVFDVLVGINLLREGLDLPEVSLVAILDADKEGFLRSARSLIQTIGRAARNVNGTVIMYADTVTDSMQHAHRRDGAPAHDPAGATTRSTASCRTTIRKAIGGPLVAIADADYLEAPSSLRAERRRGVARARRDPGDARPAPQGDAEAPRRARVRARGRAARPPARARAPSARPRGRRAVAELDDGRDPTRTEPPARRRRRRRRTPAPRSSSASRSRRRPTTPTSRPSSRRCRRARACICCAIAHGKVIYVGKAKSLRSRVRCYFRGGDERAQVQFLVEPRRQLRDAGHRATRRKR